MFSVYQMMAAGWLRVLFYTDHKRVLVQGFKACVTCLSNLSSVIYVKKDLKVV